MTSPKSESPGGAGQVAEESAENIAIVAPDEQACNERLAATVAAFALRGHEVHQLSDGFLVCRWGMTKHCPDLRTLIAFGRQLGAIA